MTFYHPTRPEHFQERNALLQQTLRPDPLPFSIDTEYPIVLAPAGRGFSYCQDFEEQLCSHANLWPRKAISTFSQKQYPVGLVGNVATDPRWRGHGHMRSLLTAIEETARHQQLSSLVLWSDLSSFYQNLGYKSLGMEFHAHFLGTPKPVKLRTRSSISKWEKSALQEAELQILLELRYPTALTLQRSLSEFLQLLAIPWLSVWLAQEEGQTVGYAIIGKGYDMIGVIHEWGAFRPEIVLDLIDSIKLAMQLNHCMLLAPFQLAADWLQVLTKCADQMETVPMALIKNLDSSCDNKELESLFIWGLDSI